MTQPDPITGTDKHCRYCDRIMDVSPRSYQENPFCRHCLHERMEKAAAEFPPGHWEPQGDYVVWVEDSRA